MVHNNSENYNYTVHYKHKANILWLRVFFLNFLCFWPSHDFLLELFLVKIRYSLLF